MKSVLVIGMGTIGIYLARKMQDLGNEVMIADKDEELIRSFHLNSTTLFAVTARQTEF